jgi:hypothetical protein
MAKSLATNGYTKPLGLHIDKWLDKYRDHYRKVYNDMEIVIDKRMAFEEKNGWSVNDNKNKYFNESLNDLVRNVHAGDPVIEYRGDLVQQLDPIYQSPQPTWAGDYRTAFFLPEKNLLGTTVSTYIFNVVAIWFMCVILYTTLALKLPQKLLGKF